VADECSSRPSITPDAVCSRFRQTLLSMFVELFWERGSRTLVYCRSGRKGRFSVTAVALEATWNGMSEHSLTEVWNRNLNHRRQPFATLLDNRIYTTDCSHSCSANIESRSIGNLTRTTATLLTGDLKVLPKMPCSAELQLFHRTNPSTSRLHPFRLKSLQYSRSACPQYRPIHQQDLSYPPRTELQSCISCMS
jgi:hypothetical protein